MFAIDKKLNIIESAYQHMIECVKQRRYNKHIVQLAELC